MGVHYVSGSDEVLVADAASELVHRLVGDADRTLVVDEFDPALGEVDVARVADAAQTPPFLTQWRVVLLRGVGGFTADQLEPLVVYLADPSPTTELVLVSSAGRVPKALTDALKAAGASITSLSPPGAGTSAGRNWVKTHLDGSPLRFDAAATAAVTDWVGEEPGRIVGLVETLLGAYGAQARIGLDDVAPFLGEGAGVPPWELTDAIDRGDTAKALGLLHRMLHGGQRHPLQILATLHGHYSRLLRIDGAGADDPAAVAALLGAKSDFQARKALTAHRALGSSGVARAIGLLAQADVDLKGDKDWPPELVAEVLVARLSRLAGVSPRR